ncbi:MAG TPA: hypothetical protein VIJ16_10195 [Gemmatimonadaceae bacterium]
MAFALLFASAATAQAQGGSRGGAHDDGPPKEKPHIVTSDSVERLNPISPIIEHRKDIGVPDSLVGKLGGILARLDAANALLLQQVDSLAANPGGPVEISDDAGRGDRDAVRHRPVSLEGIFAEVTKNNDAAGAEAVGLMSGKTADRALKLMNDQRRKMNKLLEDSGVRRGRGR